MPATPAWPPAAPGDSGVRLFVDQPLSVGIEIEIEGAQAHYLLNVMRLRVGAGLHLFDDRTGEYNATVTNVCKRALTVALTVGLRPRETVPDLWLAAAPIRRARYDWVAEKACELGVARFTPVLTRRAVVDRVKPDRLRAQMIEAAEQCGRTAMPIVDDAVALETWLARLGAEDDARTLLFADEEGGVPIAQACAAHPGPTAILIGPEGGFDDAERTAVRAHPHAVAISLGPRILRADTAAVAAVAVWMSVAGDWAEPHG